MDLPGYGFAKVPLEVQSQWDQLLSAYLRTRAALRGLVVIMDVRHPLTPLDQQLLDWFAPTGKPVLVLLTKADKLTRQHAAPTAAGCSQGIESMRSYALFERFRDGRRGGARGSSRVCSTPSRRELRAGTRARARNPLPADACLSGDRKENPRLKGIKPGVKPQLD